jgi:hypothetical protein
LEDHVDEDLKDYVGQVMQDMVKGRRWGRRSLQAGGVKEEYGGQEDFHWQGEGWEGRRWYWENCSNPEALSEDVFSGQEEDDWEDQQEDEGSSRLRRFCRPSPQKLMQAEVARWARRRLKWQGRRVMRELKRLVGLRAYVGYHFGRYQGGGDEELWSVASEDADAAGCADSEFDFEAAEGDEEEHALVSVQEDEVEETAIVEGSAKEQVSQGLQFSLHRFFKGPAGQHDPRGDEPVLVRGGFRPDQRKRAKWAAPLVEEQVASKKRQVEMQAMVQAVVEAKQKSIALYGEDGSRAGFFGGRPKSSKEDLRGSFNGVDKSNRIMAGQTRRRIDMDPWEGLEMCEFMEGQVGRYATEDSYWRAMVCRYRPKTKRILQGILDRKEVFKAKIKERNLAKGTKMRKRACSGRSGGMLRGEAEVGRGCRALGGGRKDPYQEQKQQVKGWAIKEKQHGHCLNAGDL